MTPRVSVLLPVFNGAETLPAALRSIAWQTWREWELVLVDDGSSDQSLALARAAAARDPRIRVLPRAHEGLVASLQAGLVECRGELVARMDADDIAHPDRLARQVLFLETHPDIAVVGSRVRIFPARTRTAGMARYESWLNSLVEPETMERDLLVESPLVHPSVVFRRATIQAVGGYRDSRGPEDYDLWLRLHEGGARFGKVPEVLLFWRDAPLRVTRTDPRCGRDRFREVKLDFLLRTRLAGIQPFMLWGAGPNGKALARELAARGRTARAFIDSHPARRGQKISGLPVLGPEQAPPPGQFLLLSTVGHPQARAQIRALLAERGHREGRDFVCLA